VVDIPYATYAYQWSIAREEHKRHVVIIQKPKAGHVPVLNNHKKTHVNHTGLYYTNWLKS
jgi:hypothetical protein